MALDVGERRIGLALANSIARLPNPLRAVQNDATLWDQLRTLIEHEGVTQLVIGLPRGLDGQETPQTKYCRDFMTKCQSEFSLPCFLQDEALTSRQAEAELEARGNVYTKGDIDALAAALILGDFMANQAGKNE